MKTNTLLLGLIGIAVLASSCYTEVILEDEFITAPAVNTDQTLQAYDLWYVDINASRGNGEIPFLQQAFTLSFVDGIVFANNNIVGLGKTGNGFGIAVGVYDTFSGIVDIDHDVDGFWGFEVYALGPDVLELYNTRTNSTYVLNGYQRGNFDYDRLFYENIDLLLQEFEAWEKTFTSAEGAVNEFDEENFLYFFGNRRNFQSSADPIGTSISKIQWDYQGNYEIFDTNDETLKTLTLDYDYLGNDYFELYVIDDSTVELYHVASETVYEFTGRGFLQVLKGKEIERKERKKANNAKMSVSRKRKL
ncbi:MAG: nicotinic acid mononucleotide adenyltransferase [Bacteroidota bacterium]